jgi:hypothetical protein
MPITYSTTAPAVSFERVTGGTRVRREGKGDTLFVTRDDRSRRYPAWLVIQHGVGVVGRIVAVDRWTTLLEYGVFRHWDRPGVWQVFPSSTVRTEMYNTVEQAMTEAAMWFCS